MDIKKIIKIIGIALLAIVVFIIGSYVYNLMHINLLNQNKIDQNKDFVYLIDQYKIDDKTNLKNPLSRLKKPLINLKFNNINNINKEIDNAYKAAKETIYYNEKNVLLGYSTYNYEFYVAKDILAIHTTSEEYYLDESVTTENFYEYNLLFANHKVYNIDIQTGKLLNNKELVKRLNYSSATILDKIKNLLKVKEISICGENKNERQLIVSQCYYELNDIDDIQLFPYKNHKVVVLISEYTNAGVFEIPYEINLDNSKKEMENDNKF